MQAELPSQAASKVLAQRSYERRHAYCCFKPLSFEVICCAATDNQYPGVHVWLREEGSRKRSVTRFFHKPALSIGLVPNTVLDTPSGPFPAGADALEGNPLNAP